MNSSFELFRGIPRANQRFLLVLLVCLTAVRLPARDQPLQAQPAPAPVAQTPPAQAPEAQAQPPAPAVLENTGSPIVLPFHCTREDLDWGGLSCSEEEPCAIYLELIAADAVGERIFLAGDVHSKAVTLYSVLLDSEDGGRTWREAFPRIRGAGLDRVQFIGTETGWATGLSLYPLPEDPFVLVTSDGGKTWRRRNIFPDDRESRAGAIQQVSFITKDTGHLIIDRGPGSEGDRYELYESPNGGDTWTIKEESTKPLKLKDGLLANPNWRIRADASTEAFRVEQHHGDRWIPVASFAVKLAPCGAPEP